MRKKIALVTGASRGIGRAIALELAASFTVVVNYARRGADAAAAVAAIEAAGGAAVALQADVGDRAAVDAMFRDLDARFGGLDVLVNNAGIAPRERRDVVDATEESFDELIGTNLKGPHFLTQLAARWMLEQGSGRIVFVTSISSYTASVNRAEYCISKAGLSMSVAVWAQRLAAHGIGVFEVRPGIVRTDMIAAVEKAYDEKIANGLLPQRRMGESSDVAKAIRAVADGLLDYSTGQVINVDGGFHLRSL
jgi:NAD(P)-dependent dehydrogenase (short-subunit alcohol dehydrogenase family)